MQARTVVPPQEAAISTDKAQSWVYCEEFLPEDDIVLRARERAAQLGCTPVLPGLGRRPAVLAAAVAARAVVEIGTGAGVGSLYLLRGMPADGVLTTIDLEVEHQRAAKEAFAEEGVKPTRTRTISGRALDVLPRLTDGGYDLVFVDADKENTRATSSRPSGCCDRAVSSPSTTPSGTTGSPTPRGATRRRPPSARSAGSSVPTTASSPRCSPPATVCSSPSSAELPVRPEELAQLARRRAPAPRTARSARRAAAR